jgi:hypothetical protein
MLLGRVRGSSTQASWRGRSSGISHRAASDHRFERVPAVRFPLVPCSGALLSNQNENQKDSIRASMLSCRRRRWRSQGLAAMQKCAACLSEERDVAKTCSVLATRACEGYRPHPEEHRQRVARMRARRQAPRCVSKLILRSIARRCVSKGGCGARTRGHPSKRRALRRKTAAKRTRLFSRQRRSRCAGMRLREDAPHKYAARRPGVPPGRRMDCPG